MPAELDERSLKLLEGPNMAQVATTDRDGNPRVLPAWIDTDGTMVRLNSQEGRAWPGRLRRTGRVTVAVMNAEATHEYVEIVGRLAEETTDGAKEHLDGLSRKYIGIDYPNHFEGEVRVIFVIEPVRVNYVNLLEGTPGKPKAS